MPIVTAAQMRQIEQNALNWDISFHRLMENAGSAAAAFIRRTFVVDSRRVIIFCGAGNNGGDGLVVARKLAEEGAEVTVALLDGIPTSEEAAAMYTTAGMMDIPMLDFGADNDNILALLAGSDIVVDAICGTGFKGGLRPAHRAACAAINDAIAVVVSLDIPTGVECDTGGRDPDAVRADFTIAFDSHKPAHMLPGSQPLCGTVEVVDIGIPPEAREGIAALSGCMTLEQVLELLPVRPLDCHKGMFGRLLNIAGCARYRGAAVLSAAASLRVGAGLSVLASTQEVCAAVSAQLPEAILLPLVADDYGYLNASFAIPALEEELAVANAVLIGCGLGDGDHTAALLEYVLRKSVCPVIIDADGINALSRHIYLLRSAQGTVILTPHPGEMARLCGVDATSISVDRAGYATHFAKEHGVIVALKGQGTLIASPDGELLINTTGNPGLAKGGSGDVLAGVIAGLAAQGIPAFDATACGVYLHGLSGDKTAARRGQYAMLPSETLTDLAEILAQNGR